MLIGLCGPEGAGKSMAAKILAVELRGTIWPFAGPLKRMIEALGVDPRHLYGTPADKAEPLAIFGGKTARHAMQTLGTEWGRECIDSGVWLRAWAAGLPCDDPVISDDVRFANEAEAIFARGGYVLRIVRSESDLGREPKHASEDFRRVPFSLQVVNDKCPTILKQRLIQGLNDLQAKRWAASAAAAE